MSPSRMGCKEMIDSGINWRNHTVAALCLITLSVVGLLISLVGASEKKGLCLAVRSHPDYPEKCKKTEVVWFYRWMPAKPGKLPSDVDFIPMIWGDNHWSLDGINKLKVFGNAKKLPLLGFNEPDSETQANMSVARAIKLWPLLENTNRYLGSPVTVHADCDWMKKFMSEADKKKLRVDFVCIHWYGKPDAKQFIRHIEKIIELYKRPVWITEFAVADWKAKKERRANRYSQEQVVQFMKDVLPYLERNPMVERYAWFHAGKDNLALSCSCLFEPDGSLTEVGEYYAKDQEKLAKVVLPFESWTRKSDGKSIEARLVFDTSLSQDAIKLELRSGRKSIISLDILIKENKNRIQAYRRKFFP